MALKWYWLVSWMIAGSHDGQMEPPHSEEECLLTLVGEACVVSQEYLADTPRDTDRWTRRSFHVLMQQDSSDVSY